MLPHELSGHTIWCTCGVTLWLPTGALNGYARNMALSERQLLDAISRTPFIDSTELALILGEPHATVHRSTVRPAGRRHRRTSEPRHRPPAVEPEILPDGQRYQTGCRSCSALRPPRTSCGPTPMSREWLTLLIRRMDAVASRLPTRRLDVPRHRRAQAPAWSSTAGAASTPPSRCTTAAASAWCARAWPCGAGLSTTG